MGVIIHVVDGGRETSNGRSDKDIFSKNNRPESGTRFVHIGLMTNGVEQALKDVIKAAGSDKIRKLIFTGHGDSGSINIGAGDKAELLLYKPTDSKEDKDKKKTSFNESSRQQQKYLQDRFEKTEGSRIGSDSSDTEFQVWGMLRGRFDSDGEVILVSCNTGEGEKGKALVTRLAKIVGVPVYAAASYQLIGQSKLVGYIVIGKPDGSSSIDKQSGEDVFARMPAEDKVTIAGANAARAVGSAFQNVKKVLGF